MSPKLFSFTHFRKNGSATPLESHTFKTKDLKPFRFTHLQKKGGGYPHFPPIPTPLCQCDSSQGGVFYPTSNAKPPTSALPRPTFNFQLSTVDFLTVHHVFRRPLLPRPETEGSRVKLQRRREMFRHISPIVPARIEMKFVR